MPAPPPGEQGPRTPPQVKPIWQRPADRRFNGFVVAGDVLLAAGHTGSTGADTSFLAAINVEDGSDLWQEKLAGPVVKGGTAVNHRGQIFVSLENGKILAFAAPD